MQCGQEEWLNTQLQVEIGDTVVYKWLEGTGDQAGSIFWPEGRYLPSDPDQEQDLDAVDDTIPNDGRATNCRIYSLVAAISEGDPGWEITDGIQVNRALTMTATSAGKLWLVCNDVPGGFADNSGGWTVEVTVYRPD